MHAKRTLSDDTYVELVGSVFATVLPTLIMSALFACVGGLAATRSPDRPLHGLVATGILLSVVRVMATLRFRRRLSQPGATVARARAIERVFAIIYIAFAVLLGLFAARALAVLPADAAMLACVLIVGYAAGVSTGTGLRPRISIPSMVAAVVPTAIVAAAGPDAAHRILAATLLSLLTGGVHSTLLRYRTSLEGIAMRRSFSTLARQDHLTRLPNRLAVAERFHTSGPGDQTMIVYYIDLDDFKPVNDRYGHPAGDAVLRNVADRLRALLGEGDFAARLGGDEFLFVQAGVPSLGEEAAMSRRLAAALAAPHLLDGATVHVGASIGTAVFGPGHHISQAIAAADAALLRSKRDHRRHHARTVLSQPVARAARR